MNRARREDESYEEYRQSLRDDTRQRTQYLKGTVSWCSAALKPGRTPGTFYKVLVNGTYIKSKHGMV